MAKFANIAVLVSADGFSWTMSLSVDGSTWTPAGSGDASDPIDVFKGDVFDFQPSGPNPPTSVTVTVDVSDSGADALFGTASPPVPSRQTVDVEDSIFLLDGGGGAWTVRVDEGGRPVNEPDPPPDPSGHS